MSLFLTFPFFLLAPWLAGKQSDQPENFPRQSIAIRLSVFPAIFIRTQLFDTKALLGNFDSAFSCYNSLIKMSALSDFQDNLSPSFEFISLSSSNHLSGVWHAARHVDRAAAISIVSSLGTGGIPVWKNSSNALIKFGK